MATRLEQATRLPAITASRLQMLFASITSDSFQYRTATSLALLLPCIVILRKMLVARAGSKHQEKDAPGHVSDTIGTGEISVQCIGWR